MYILFERTYSYEGYTDSPEEHVPTFHILISTGGRPSLKEMLDSLKGELTERDAITVVFDGSEAKEKSTYNESWLEGHQAKINIIEQDPNLGFWGHAIRNKYIPDLSPKTTFILNADDDDIYIGGSFDILRKKCNDPDTLYISKMNYHESHKDFPLVIPRPDTNDITYGNVGTPNGIIPFLDAKKSIFTHVHGGDYEYYHGLKDKVKNIVFLDDIIYTVVR